VHAFFGEAQPVGQRAAALVVNIDVQGDPGEAEGPECLGSWADFWRSRGGR
jgi:hypothetical protein